MVSKNGYNTEPGWAMLVEIEVRVLEGVFVEMDKTQVLTHGFNTEPGWAMLVEVESIFSKDLLSKWTELKF